MVAYPDPIRRMVSATLVMTITSTNLLNRGRAIKQPDTLGIRVWVTPQDKQPRPVDLLDMAEGNLEWTASKGVDECQLCFLDKLQ